MIPNLLTPRISLLGVEFFRYLGVWGIGILMIRCWGSGELLIAYESFAFILQLITFSLVWAITSEFQTQFSESFFGDQHDSVFIELICILSCLGLVAGLVISSWGLLQDRSVLLWAGFTLHACFFLPTVLMEYYLIKHKRYLKALLLMSTSQVLMALCVVLPLLLNWPNQMTFFLFPVVSFGRWVVLAQWVQFRFFHVSRKSLSKRIKRILPVMGSFLLAGSQLHWAGLVVGWFLTPADFLSYRFGIRELPLVHLLAAPIWLQSAHIIGKYRLWTTSARMATWCLLYMQQETFRLIRLVFPVHILIIILAPGLFRLMYDQALESACIPFQVMLLIPVAAAINPRGILLGFDDRQTLFRISVAEALFHASLCVLLTWWLGVVGVACALVASSAFERWLLVQRSLRLGMTSSKWIPYKWLVVFLVAGIGVIIYQQMN